MHRRMQSFFLLHIKNHLKKNITVGTKKETRKIKRGKMGKGKTNGKKKEKTRSKIQLAPFGWS